MDVKLLESNRFFKAQYEELQKIVTYADTNGIGIDSICRKFFNVYPRMLPGSETEEEKAFLNACKREMVDCYQKALERNYMAIKEHKERGVTDHGVMDTWMLTLDEQGNPKKTRVVDVDEKGGPVYADNCTDAEIARQLQNVWDYRRELDKWLESSDNLYELKKAALALKEKGRLGMESVPAPNRDLSGLVGGQLDFAAWQNYTIESGLYRPTDYDRSLEHLLSYLDECIDFYEKAMSMV